jgi:hypothetical protein
MGVAVSVRFPRACARVHARALRAPILARAGVRLRLCGLRAIARSGRHSGGPGVAVDGFVTDRRCSASAISGPPAERL